LQEKLQDQEQQLHAYHAEVHAAKQCLKLKEEYTEDVKEQLPTTPLRRSERFIAGQQHHSTLKKYTEAHSAKRKSTGLENRRFDVPCLNRFLIFKISILKRPSHGKEQDENDIIVAKHVRFEDFRPNVLSPRASRLPLREKAPSNHQTHATLQR
jgi:hypothetical protein